MVNDYVGYFGTIPVAGGGSRNVLTLPGAAICGAGDLITIRDHDKEIGKRCSITLLLDDQLAEHCLTSSIELSFEYKDLNEYNLQDL